jgi:hypothetical protein
MIWRILGGLAGVGVVGTATHLNVVHAGGYQAEDAPLIIAVAVLVASGMGFVSWAFSEGYRAAAVLLGLLFLVGEGYWVLTNADRELVARQAQTAPIADAQRARNLAEKRLADAKKAKTDAGKAAVEEAAKPGCKSNCAAMLMAAQTTANTELADARTAYAAAKIPGSATALAANLGIEQWQWDLFIAALRSGMIAAGALALGIAIHPSKWAKPTARAEIPHVEKTEDGPASSQAMTTVARPLNRREHVSQFLHAVIRPDESSGASLRALHGKYSEWCQHRAVDQLPTPALGQELRDIIDAIGLKCEPCDGDIIIRGASFK